MKCDFVLLASKTFNLCYGDKDDVDPHITEFNTMHTITI